MILANQNVPIGWKAASKFKFSEKYDLPKGFPLNRIKKVPLILNRGGLWKFLKSDVVHIQAFPYMSKDRIEIKLDCPFNFL